MIQCFGYPIYWRQLIKSFEGATVFFMSIHSAKFLLRIILAGLCFTQNSIYFNPARISPKVLSYQMERIVIPGNQTYPPNALLIMLGAVAECSIVNPAIGEQI